MANVVVDAIYESIPVPREIGLLIYDYQEPRPHIWSCGNPESDQRTISMTIGAQSISVLKSTNYSSFDIFVSTVPIADGAADFDVLADRPVTVGIRMFGNYCFCTFAVRERTYFRFDSTGCLSIRRQASDSVVVCRSWPYRSTFRFESAFLCIRTRCTAGYNDSQVIVRSGPTDDLPADASTIAVWKPFAFVKNPVY